MPSDSVKRKQLELKIAAAARQHAQKRRQERDYGTHILHTQRGLLGQMLSPATLV